MISVKAMTSSTYDVCFCGLPTTCCSTLIWKTSKFLPRGVNSSLRGRSGSGGSSLSLQQGQPFVHSNMLSWSSDCLMGTLCTFFSLPSSIITMSGIVLFLLQSSQLICSETRVAKLQIILPSLGTEV